MPKMFQDKDFRTASILLMIGLGIYALNLGLYVFCILEDSDYDPFMSAYTVDNAMAFFVWSKLIMFPLSVLFFMKYKELQEAMSKVIAIVLFLLTLISSLYIWFSLLYPAAITYASVLYGFLIFVADPWIVTNYMEFIASWIAHTFFPYDDISSTW